MHCKILSEARGGKRETRLYSADYELLIASLPASGFPPPKPSIDEIKEIIKDYETKQEHVYEAPKQDAVFKYYSI